MRRRHHENLGFDRARIHAGRVPELGARGGQRVHHDQPLEVAEGLHHPVRVGSDAGGGHATEDEPLHFSLQCLVVDAHPG